MSNKQRERLKNQKRDRLTCPLRDIEKKRCSVYSVRPKICELYGYVEGLRCPNNPESPLISRAVANFELRGIQGAVGVLGVDIGWKQLEKDTLMLWKYPP